MFSAYDWWGLGAATLALLLPLVVMAYNQVKASKWGQHHDAIMRIWGLADDIATRIVAQIGPNPSDTTRAQFINAGLAQLKVAGAQALTQIVGGASDETLSTLLSTKVTAQSVAATAAVAITQAAQAASTAAAAVATNTAKVA